MKTIKQLIVSATLCLISSAAVNATVLNGVTVSSNPLWTDTGITLSSGSFVDISATGLWTASYVNWAPYGPDGLSSVSTSDNFYSGANSGELIAYVGADPTQGHWTVNNTFFPQATGYWAIGSHGSFTAPVSGELWLGFNDDAAGTLWTVDNSGSVIANITVVPEPGTFALVLLGAGLAYRCSRKQ